MLREEFDRVFFGEDRLDDHAHDCPVRYEVWLAYATDEAVGVPHDVMLNASEDVSAQDVAERLLRSLEAPAHEYARLALSGDYVAASVTLATLVRHVIPLTSWRPLLDRLRVVLERPGLMRDILRGDSRSYDIALAHDFALSNDADIAGASKRAGERFDRLSWFTRLLVATYLRTYKVSSEGATEALEALLGVPQIADEAVEATAVEKEMVETVTLNRKATKSVAESRKTVKADAAIALFEVSCESLTWAVLDAGVDARHPAFCIDMPDGELIKSAEDTWHSRVTATYDFTRIRDVLTDFEPGRPDWTQLDPELRVPHSSAYVAPESDHGTHVAGILGADWPGEGLKGICPDIKLWDLRVLDARGEGYEFDILAALQFLRWTNEQQPRLAVVGANLSLSLPHEVANYSCGWTPICVECDRLVRAGVVVVTVAGNAAFGGTETGLADGTSYRAISVTDPGNAESVITVGATHRSDPHRHGVSFFSGRGPTADGRIKPDLLAPGERIDGPVPREGIRRMTGTSQAAPHVSGAAALLMARYRELLGRPERVKEILCGSATDLGRAQTFQGNGLLDVLRAMQSV